MYLPTHTQNFKSGDSKQTGWPKGTYIWNCFMNLVQGHVEIMERHKKKKFQEN